MKQAMPTTPLQFLSTGFRFIAWETRLARLHGACLPRRSMKNGIGRFALADPMNDADANIEVARYGEA